MSDFYPPKTETDRPETDNHAIHANPTNSTHVYESTFRMEFLLEIMIVLVIFRFLYELKHCCMQCWSYTTLKLKEKQRLLTMTMTSDNLDDLLLTECSVCLDEFTIGDKVMILPCYHNFHEKCIREWLPLHQNCPLCRANILE
jgi:hypothetical protein